MCSDERMRGFHFMLRINFIGRYDRFKTDVLKSIPVVTPLRGQIFQRKRQHETKVFLQKAEIVLYKASAAFTLLKLHCVSRALSSAQIDFNFAFPFPNPRNPIARRLNSRDSDNVPGIQPQTKAMRSPTVATKPRGRNHDRHVSGTGTRGLPKKGGAGGKTVWGSEMDQDPVACLDKNDPNYNSDDEQVDADAPPQLELTPPTMPQQTDEQAGTQPGNATETSGSSDVSSPGTNAPAATSG